MIDFVSKRNIYFLISVILLAPGIISLATKSLRPGIDFVGGARLEFDGGAIVNAPQEEIQDKIQEVTPVSSIQKTGENTWLIRTKDISQQQSEEIRTKLSEQYQDTQLLRFETVGPTIGAELTRNALIALALSWIAIILYVAYSFRAVPAPMTSWRFGVTAIIALIHDALLVIGVFSILGWTMGVEIDALFVTAVLTIMGFSVHDTIVVYDRIRENLIKKKGKNLEDTINIALNETLVRSINTSGTVLFVLAALLAFGGESIRWFTFALLLGILVGAYSSIFVAAQLLIVWQNWANRRKTI